MSGSVDDLKKQYESQWSPESYLEDYVSEKSPWEKTLVSNLHDIIETGKVRGPRGIDIGCGPTVHRMSILARVCEEILACDFTPSNLEFVEKWLKDVDGPAGPMSTSLRAVAEFEGYRDPVIGERALCERLRSKVKHVVRVDVTCSESVEKLLQYGGPFDCAHSNGVLESACLSYEAYVAALKKISTLLKPGGAFVLSGYLNGNYYNVNGVAFECLKWDVDFVKRGLKEAGFRLDTIIQFETPEEQYRDYSNCLDGFSSLSYKN